MILVLCLEREMDRAVDGSVSGRAVCGCVYTNVRSTDKPFVFILKSGTQVRVDMRHQGMLFSQSLSCVNEQLFDPSEPVSYGC